MGRWVPGGINSSRGLSLIVDDENDTCYKDHSYVLQKRLLEKCLWL